MWCYCLADSPGQKSTQWGSAVNIQDLSDSAMFLNN